MWDGYDPNLSTIDPVGTKIPARDPKTGEVIFVRDSDGNPVLDKKKNPIPVMVQAGPYALNEAQEKRIADNQRVTQEIRDGKIENIDIIADRIASGHSSHKHVQGRQTLQLDGAVIRMRDGKPILDAKVDIPGDGKGTYGIQLDIKNKDDLKNHIKSTLTDPSSVGYVKKDGTIITYNERTNTLVVMNPTNPDGGTVYRADDGVKNFVRCLNNDYNNGNLTGTTAQVLRQGGIGQIINPANASVPADVTTEQRLSQLGLTMLKPGTQDRMTKPLGHPSLNTVLEDIPRSSQKPARLGGLAGGALMIAASAANAAEQDGRSSASAGDYARAAWEQTIGDPLSKRRYAEVAMRVLEKADLTAGLLSGGMREAFKSAGLDVDPSVMHNLKIMTAEQRQELRHNSQLLAYYNRDQFFLLQSVGLTELRDADGKRMDIAALLRDPAQRASFIHQLNTAAQAEQNPAEKEKLQHMVGVVKDFADIEGQRYALLDKTSTLLAGAQTKPAATATASVSPIAPQVM